MNCRRVVWVAGVVSLLFAGLTAAPVEATVIKLEPFKGTDSFEYSDCGYPCMWSLNSRARETSGSARRERVLSFFARTSPTVRSTRIRSPASGSWCAAIPHSGRSKLPGWRATSSTSHRSSGQPFVVEDSSGQVVVRDCGGIGLRSCSTPAETIIQVVSSSIFSASRFVARIRVSPPTSAASLVASSGSATRRSGSRSSRGDHGVAAGVYRVPPARLRRRGASPLLVFLHGFGESGDGSKEQLPNLARTGIPRTSSTTVGRTSAHSSCWPRSTRSPATPPYAV